MNDFTKEELDLIYEVLDKDCWELHVDLQSKIRRMIENYDNPEYCAHSGVKLEKKHG